MRYQSFEIHNYRGISRPLVIEVRHKTLIPIIGINESGKTTVLQALFAFDHSNDELNDGRHLEDVANLLHTAPPSPTVTATIKCRASEVREAIEAVEEEENVSLPGLKRKADLGRMTITRDLETKEYVIGERPFAASKHQDSVAREVLRQLPYILYFDDFRDKLDERIEIPANSEAPLSGWVAIMQQLFRQTDKKLSIFSLAGMEDRQRKSALAKVQRHLNTTLTREWQHFRLDEVEMLQIGLEFERHPAGPPRGYLKLEVVERDASGDDHFFYITDRSKGFYWFFNFVMKLEFNPKILIDSDQGSIYLLDEPGSYLHATAQIKLCEKLKGLTEHNTVIYCTHSHYLLNPEVIPLSSIVVAEKDGDGNVSLVPIDRHKGNILDRRSAFQPVIDALQIKPFILDISHSLVVLVEGMYDYFALELFRGERPVSVLPSVGAESIKFYVSLMIAWQVRFKAVWDNDKAGRAAMADARRHFGDEVARRSFHLLPVDHEGQTRILQDLFDGEDLLMLRRELGIESDTSFEKTLASVFYSPRKGELAGKIGKATSQRFVRLWDTLMTSL